MSFHKGKKPFECKTCKNIFTFLIKLSEHIVSFHEGKKIITLSVHERKKLFHFIKEKSVITLCHFMKEKSHLIVKFARTFLHFELI